ncbi:hypothetical protein FC756_15705 [Lysinibacillus mangiferihumi]|uniref:DUF3221 domain-containing protein n=1 Tax=Lysinibacillus mangiferihumi TaxID=1130819 RepID=A0A4U2YWL2_9BACI|nr:DUF3221 domain-containing protein [Lysinibacillus mangiferihumi]TKI65977.1 hypothetical protein FC756_15705 [Lysinibacillus mangiferihumi]
MSKMDVRVIRDLTESKKRVMTNVVKQIEHRAISKPSRRGQYSMYTVILTICIGLFIYTQVNNGDKLSANAVPILDETIYDMILHDAGQTDESQFTSLNFQTLIEFDAYYAYAVSKGIKFSQTAITERQLYEREQFINAIKNDMKMKKMLAKLKLSPNEYYEKYIGVNAVKIVAHAELMKEYYRKFDSSFQIHARSAVKKEAMDYFTAKYGQQIAYLENKYNVSKPNMSTQYKYGTVVAMEEDRFLVVTGALQEEIGQLSNEEIINKHTNGVWFPLQEVQDKIAIGQSVNVTYNWQAPLNQYDFVANLEEIEISK